MATNYALTPSTTMAVEGNQVAFTITRSGSTPAETIYFSARTDGTATYAGGDFTTTSTFIGNLTKDHGVCHLTSLRGSSRRPTATSRDIFTSQGALREKSASRCSLLNAVTLSPKHSEPISGIGTTRSREC